MQPVLSPASDADFGKVNGETRIVDPTDARVALGGWALVMGIAIVSFLVHVHPSEGLTAEQAAQGLLVMGAAAALAQGGVARLADSITSAPAGTATTAQVERSGA